jgi:hypothetical protein
MDFTVFVHETENHEPYSAEKYEKKNTWTNFLCSLLHLNSICHLGRFRESFYQLLIFQQNSLKVLNLHSCR